MGFLESICWCRGFVCYYFIGKFSLGSRISEGWGDWGKEGGRVNIKMVFRIGYLGDWLFGIKILYSLGLFFGRVKGEWFYLLIFFFSWLSVYFVGYEFKFLSCVCVSEY